MINEPSLSPASSCREDVSPDDADFSRSDEAKKLSVTGATGEVPACRRSRSYSRISFVQVPTATTGDGTASEEYIAIDDTSAAISQDLQSQLSTRSQAGKCAHSTTSIEELVALSMWTSPPRVDTANRSSCMLAEVISAGACHDAAAEAFVMSDQIDTPWEATCTNRCEPGSRAAAMVGDEAIAAPRSASRMSDDRCRSMVDCAVDRSKEDWLWCLSDQIRSTPVIPSMLINDSRPAPLLTERSEFALDAPDAMTKCD